MHLSWVIIAQGANQGSDSGSIVTMSYIVGSIAAIMGIVGGLYRFYNKQKQRWIEDGETRAKQAQILEQNTHAVTDLTRKMDEFVSSVRTELAGITARISHLERRRPGSGT